MGRFTLSLIGHGIVVSSSDGTRVAGPFAFGSLWPPPAEPCGVDVEWPPAIHADKTAQRWVISRWFQSMPDKTIPFCIAVSRSADPVSGGWSLYDFSLPIGSPDASLEVSSEGYRLPARSGAQQVYVTFDRAAMLAGKPAGFTVDPR